MQQIRTRSLGTFNGLVTNLCVSPDGKHALTAIRNTLSAIKYRLSTQLFIIDVTGQQTLRLLKHIYGKNNSFAYSPDGSCIVSAAIDEFNIIIIELDDSRRKVKNIIPVDMLSC